MPETNQPESRTRRVRKARRVPNFGNQAGAALLPVVACFLGGATEKWAEGIVVALLGLFLFFDPPRLSLGKLLNVVLVLFVACAGLAFLPSAWFFQPEWRTAFVGDLGGQLPSTVSAQPWISGTCLISLIAGVAWLYFSATQESDLRGIRFQMRLFVSGIVALAALSIILHLAKAPLPFWFNARNFGPFPNRNQTGDLFGIASIVLLACGQDDIRYKRKRWIIWLVALGVLVTAIILNLSRAGMAILVGGSVLWIAAVSLRQRTSARIALAVSFLLLLLTAILVLGGQTLERFHLRGFGSAGVLTADFRWKIFQDVFGLLQQSPWCGLGLGNFEPVFAMFRVISLNETRALHPESDWLWMWAEMGWPAVALTIVGAVLLLRHVLPLQEGTNQRFRLAALLGAVVFAVHGLVDVSGHRVGTAYAGIFLLGACLHRPLNLKASRVLPIFFRLLGLFLIVAGSTWTIATRNKTLLPGSVGVTSVKKLTPVSLRGRNFAEAINLSSRGLDWAPLDWQLYFSRALAEVGGGKTEAALDDFRRARFLEPTSFEVPLAEGNAWLATQPNFAATAWREALRRTKTGKQRLEVYAGMLNKASVENKELGHILEEVGLSQHDLVLAYLNRVSGPLFNKQLQRFLATDPDLTTLTETEKLALFTLWSERGDLDELVRQVEAHPAWMSHAWLGLAKYHANNKDFRKAYELTQQYGEAVAMPRLTGNETLEELQNHYYASPDNYAVGYALFKEQMKRQRIDDALMTARHFTERPSAPAYFHYLEAETWAKKGNWERAWQAMGAYQKASKK